MITVIDLDILNSTDDDLTDLLYVYIQEILMVLNTDKTEVLGCPTMTVNLEELVYDINLDESAIQKLILDKLSQYTSLYDNFDTQINVKFAKGTERDVCLIDFSINSEANFSLMIK